jgi:hypothetical protein
MKCQNALSQYYNKVKHLHKLVFTIIQVYTTEYQLVKQNKHRNIVVGIIKNNAIILWKKI